MASPRRHSALIELIRDRPDSIGMSAPVRADRVKAEPASRGRSGGGGGFDVSSAAKLFAAGRRLNVPMGYVFIAVALVIASWFGVYTIGYSRAAGVAEDERIAGLTSTADPLLADNAPVVKSRPRQSTASGPARSRTSRPTPRVSSNGPTGTGLPARRGSGGASTQPSAAANRPAAVLPAATFEVDLNYLVIANDHQTEAQRAAAYLLDNGIRAAVVQSAGAWRVVGLRGFTGEQMRAGEHRQYRDTVEALGRTWERDHSGSSDFSGMFFRKEKG